MFGQGFFPVPFHVARDMAWAELFQKLGIWQSRQMAEAELSLTRNLPYWFRCGSWQEVH